MPLYYRKRVRTSRNTWLNLSKSGVSESVRITPRVTVNSRGSLRIRFGKGLYWRVGKW